MKTLFKAIITFTVAAVLPAAAVLAQEPADQQKKLQGSELTKFYLQQILDEAEDDPVADDAKEQEGLVQRLKDLVGRLEKRQQAQFAKEKQEQEKRDAEEKIKAKELLKRGAVAVANAVERVVLKPVVDDAPDERPATPAEAGSEAPSVRGAFPQQAPSVDAAVAPAAAEIVPPALNPDVRTQFQELRKRLDNLKRDLDDIMQGLETLGTDLAKLAKQS